MDFGYDARTLDLRKRLLAFMDEQIYPAEAVFAEQVAAAIRQGRPWERVPVTEELKAEARSRGLWNLFLSG
jgi:acyl-CoA dehydrogenase